MPSQTALILIDLQRDFFTPGVLKHPLQFKRLAEPLSVLISAAREAHVPLFWVMSHYPERREPPPPVRPPRPSGARYEGVPMNSDHLASGHSGRPCCVEGTLGATLMPALEALQQAEDEVIIKTRYSAFSETSLDERLKRRGIKELIIVGVTTGGCVRATVCDAFFHGYEVTVISDATGAPKEKQHKQALRSLERDYARVEHSALLLSRWRSVRRGLGAGDSALFYGVFPFDDEPGERPHRSALFETLNAELTWEQMMMRGGLVPRLVCLQGEHSTSGDEPLYRHPADEQPTLRPYTPTTQALRERCERYAGVTLNHALIQRYESGRHNISAHADKTLDMTIGAPIIGLSLGATRTFTLRSKQPGPDGEPIIQRLELPHGSLLLIGWDTNHAFTHEVAPHKRSSEELRPDELRDEGARVSLTFRSIATWRTPEGEVYGQGGRRTLLSDPAPPPRDSHEESLALLEAFAQENNQGVAFDWEATYGGGFDVVDLALLNAQPPSPQEPSLKELKELKELIKEGDDT